MSKVELGDRPASSDYLQPLAEILKLDLKEVQTKFIADKISKDFGGMGTFNRGIESSRTTN